jgi:hypothetical protein
MRAGDVVFHRDFAFHDGGTADKYLVVVGATSSIVLLAKTTSQGKRYRNDHGCQPGNYFPAFLLTAGCCFLPKNTWICFSEFYEFSLERLQQRMVEGQVYRAGMLSDELTHAVQHCAMGCFDLTRAQEAIVHACLVKLS